MIFLPFPAENGKALRVDQPRGQFFLTNWIGHGGRVASGTYTV